MIFSYMLVNLSPWLRCRAKLDLLIIDKAERADYKVIVL